MPREPVKVEERYEPGSIYWHAVEGPVLIEQNWNEKESVCKSFLNGRKKLLCHELFEWRLTYTVHEMNQIIEKAGIVIAKSIDEERFEETYGEVIKAAQEKRKVFTSKENGTGAKNPKKRTNRKGNK